MQLKVVCLNLWEGGRLFPEALEFIRAEDPDILVLQEVHNGDDPQWGAEYRSMEVLRTELPQLAHSYFAPAFLAVFSFGKLEEGNAIFSKFPIIDTACVYGDIPYGERVWDVADEAGRIKRNMDGSRSLQHARLDVLGTEVNVFNTQGIWGLDGFDNPRRLAMATQIAKQISDKKNIILCGDFNFQLEGTCALEIIEQEGGVKNIFAGALTSTFNMKRKPPTGTTYGTAIVDGIFVSPNVKVLEARCPQVDISDHLPLVATIEVGS